ncbi:NAD-dependent epimerase/dehydratase family protein [Desulfurobacterium atlanticum]|uniref:UDP-glucose 4-epimerase n=1 Tax=Desulfurobacterium atlanticum TaxID=240169 RepID=A0A238YY24_9BACT|nr:NAD-dependent epimerase/dehydratase family protein [Desulfurobacterium atlanticum]SNR76126.1 UDP-glucose 4-epimerase [Desulfurobacterium atlanticum]
MGKVLVTGGAGFIGSHLVESLLEEGREVVVFDDFSTGKMENLPENSRLTVLKGNVGEKERVVNLFDSFKFDTVFHLAAVASVAKSVENPEETHRTNFDGTMYLLDCCLKFFVSRFIFASSAAVYGDLPGLPKKEDDPVKPQTPYAVDKYASERYVLNAFNLYGLKTSALRFFNVFGPRQDPFSPYSGVVSIFVDRVLRFLNGENVEITIFGDGKQTRDFIYVKDVVKALLLVEKSEAAYGKVFNTGTGKETSLLDLLKYIENIAGKIPPVKFAPARKGDIKHSCADISNLKKIGFSPSFTVQEGLKLLFECEMEK